MRVEGMVWERGCDKGEGKEGREGCGKGEGRECGGVVGGGRGGVVGKGLDSLTPEVSAVYNLDKCVMGRALSFLSDKVDEAGLATPCPSRARHPTHQQSATPLVASEDGVQLSHSLGQEIPKSPEKYRKD